MYGISPIISVLSDIVIKEIQDEYSKSEELSKITIDLDLYNIPEIGINHLIIKFSNINAYDHNNSGFDCSISKYRSIIKLDINNLFIESVFHELKHAYIDWCIFNNGGTPIKETKEVKNFYTKDLETILIERVSDFPNTIELLRLYYYSSSLEIPSFLENHFQNPDYIRYQDKVNRMLDLSLLNLDLDQLNFEFNEILQFDIPFLKKFKSGSDFYQKSIKLLNRRGTKLKKKLNKLDYYMLNNVKKS